MYTYMFIHHKSADTVGNAGLSATLEMFWPAGALLPRRRVLKAALRVTLALLFQW